VNRSVIVLFYRLINRFNSIITIRLEISNTIYKVMIHNKNKSIKEIIHKIKILIIIVNNIS
jgi:hypothetical protein